MSKTFIYLSLQIQFSIIFVHNAAPFFYECSFPKMLNIACLMNSTAFLYMFGNFYIKSYKKDAAQKKADMESRKITPITSKVNNSFGRRKIAEKSR